MTNTNIKWAVNILEDNMGGFSREEKINYLNDVTQHGCISGCVSGTIYHYELDAIFTARMHNILERLDEIKEEYGYDVLHEYMERQGKGYVDFAESAIWLIVEDTASHLLADLENEEEEEEE
ncbi:hypothetical protein 010DV004_270 [Bacillus phage 010DV004]|nr:hypothetical protein 010DV004_4 [Bacillus phage 010DV004]QZA69202.1 hypothetical protein 010DV004_270 [Bacillus phage 010DV004]QZA69222.1 hypothetical protein 010DV005_4 [Bacillus phage 010DV005]QZA69482.1 hypothetical protein 010DV005_270 [Bacillus phage 010DV005]